MSEQMQLFWYGIAAVSMIFLIGLYGILMTKNLIRILIGLELLTKAITLFLILVGYATGQMALSQSIVITLIIVEVVVLVVAAGIVINTYKYHDSLEVKNLKNLKG